MHVIEVRNVNDALPTGLADLVQYGVSRESRNGPVLVFPTPVTTHYTHPRERVLFSAERDANPFFHLYESLWMLGGRDDVASVAHYVKRMASFSDDGKTFHGAYGFRWRRYFGLDQLDIIINALEKNPNDRRCVLQMWDASFDLGRDGKDFPCNTQVFFSVSTAGNLDMTVCNRSNDIIWGAYGANAVHFSMLQEYVASSLGRKVGGYWQVSNNFHAYKETAQPLIEKLHMLEDQDAYTNTNCIQPYELMSTDRGRWDLDLQLYLDFGPVPGLEDPFFTRVVQPMHHAYEAFRKKDDRARFHKAFEILSNCHATDWLLAANMWLTQRHFKARYNGTAD